MLVLRQSDHNSERVGMKQLRGKLRYDENMYDRRGPDGKLKDHSLLPENENEEEEEDDAGEAEPQATTLPVEDSVTKARKKLRAV